MINDFSLDEQFEHTGIELNIFRKIYKLVGKIGTFNSLVSLKGFLLVYEDLDISFKYHRYYGLSQDSEGFLIIETVLRISSFKLSGVAPWCRYGSIPILLCYLVIHLTERSGHPLIQIYIEELLSLLYELDLDDHQKNWLIKKFSIFNCIYLAKLLA